MANEEIYQSIKNVGEDAVYIISLKFKNFRMLKEGRSLFASCTLHSIL